MSFEKIGIRKQKAFPIGTSICILFILLVAVTSASFLVFFVFDPPLEVFTILCFSSNNTFHKVKKK